MGISGKRGVASGKPEGVEGWFERWIRGRAPWLSWEELLAAADRIAGKAAVSAQPSVVSGH
jgi:hypothetical protein